MDRHPAAGLLEEAGAHAGAVEIRFRGLDRGIEDGGEQQFERSLPREQAAREEVLIAYAMNGQPFKPQHGFPARLIVPGWYGMASVKWLERITVLDAPFEGYQQTRGYRIRERPEEQGEPLPRMLPRAAMIPPGVPEFATRERTVGLEACTLRGRAWSGFGPVMRVEVSADGGRTWSEATLGPTTSRWAWRAWEWRWSAREAGITAVLSRHGQHGPDPAAASRVQRRRVRQQRGAAPVGPRPEPARSPPACPGRLHRSIVKIWPCQPLSSNRLDRVKPCFSYHRTRPGACAQQSTRRTSARRSYASSIALPISAPPMPRPISRRELINRMM